MKTYTAVLHLKNKEPQKVFQLAGRVSTNLATNKDVYPEPDPPLQTLDKEIENLNIALKAKDGTKQKNQAIIDQVEVVHGMLKSEVIYVNKIAQGDKALILFSGFDCNYDATTHDIPGKALIKRVEDGSTACSAKIYVGALPEADRYKVEITTTPADPVSWTTVLDFGSLNKIEIRDLTRGQEIYIRVTGGNTHGWGISSESVAFIPR
ncbi:MAG: fibronectin type III domain-containing protein [Paludibacter sp.]|nr:fibronectin type III domain-containing protein [Paludibacter sp.]